MGRHSEEVSKIVPDSIKNLINKNLKSTIGK